MIEQNLKRGDIQVLSVDDINQKKGNASTACSVFIDGDSHRVLVIVEGATKAAAEKVMQQFPSIQTVSRDRATAYASAAEACATAQVADRFHLLQNLHDAVKEVLSQEMNQDVFLYEGEGWNCKTTNSELESLSAIEEKEASADSMTPFPNDLDERIRLADLTKRQADKYQKTVKTITMTEEGKRSSEIAKHLNTTRQQVTAYRKQAPETIQNVEDKIDGKYSLNPQN